MRIVPYQRAVLYSAPAAKMETVRVCRDCNDNLKVEEQLHDDPGLSPCGYHTFAVCITTPPTSLFVTHAVVPRPACLCSSCPVSSVFIPPLGDITVLLFSVLLVCFLLAIAPIAESRRDRMFADRHQQGYGAGPISDDLYSTQTSAPAPVAIPALASSGLLVSPYAASGAGGPDGLRHRSVTGSDQDRLRAGSTGSMGRTSVAGMGTASSSSSAFTVPIRRLEDVGLQSTQSSQPTQSTQQPRQASRSGGVWSAETGPLHSVASHMPTGDWQMLAASLPPRVGSGVSDQHMTMGGQGETENGFETPPATP